MNLYILDTNTLSDFFRAKPVVVRNVFYHLADEIVTTTVNVEEQIGGWLAAVRTARTPEQLEHAHQHLAEAVRQLSGWHILPFTTAAISRYEWLLRQRLNVGGNDLRIAAVALEADATVVTANLRDFTRVPGLRVEDWSR